MTQRRGIHEPRHRWTCDQLDRLRREFAQARTDDLALALGLRYSQVAQKAAALGLKKSPAYLQSPAAHRLDGVKGMGTRFAPGATPWNKGTHFEAGGRSAETRFKPGNVTHTWKPLGTLRVNADGYLERKLGDTGYPPRDWRGVHRVVWEAVHGPVPSKHVVCFRPGRRSSVEASITIDALELVSRAELMRRNSVHTVYPPAIARVVQLRGALTRQINKRAKDAT